MKKSYLFVLGLLAWSMIAQAQVTDMEPEDTTDSTAIEQVDILPPPVPKTVVKPVPAAPAAPVVQKPVAPAAPVAPEDVTSSETDSSNDVVSSANGATLKITVFQGNSNEHVIIESSDRSIYKKLLTSTGIALPSLIPKWGMPSETSTYQGFHKVLRMDANAKSSLYENSPMNNAVFFTKTGIALHESDQGVTGKPLSHGCVRLLKDDAKFVFDSVKAYGMANTTVEVRGEVLRSGSEMQKAFDRLNQKLMNQHYQLMDDGGTLLDQQPAWLRNEVVVYGRVYIRHPGTGVYLPESEFDPNSDYAIQVSQEESRHEGDVFTGVAEGVGSVSMDVVKGVGSVVTAPFKFFFGSDKKKKKKKKKQTVDLGEDGLE